MCSWALVLPWFMASSFLKTKISSSFFRFPNSNYCMSVLLLNTVTLKNLYTFCFHSMKAFRVMTINNMKRREREWWDEAKVTWQIQIVDIIDTCLGVVECRRHYSQLDADKCDLHTRSELNTFHISVSKYCALLWNVLGEGLYIIHLYLLT